MSTFTKNFAWLNLQLSGIQAALQELQIESGITEEFIEHS